MKTCSECNKDFDPKDRGPGTGMALTCSKWCGDARRARQQREYKQRRRDVAKAHANMTCDKCATKCDFRKFVTVGELRLGLCSKCAALASINNARESQRIAKLHEERKTEAQERQQLLAELDALVRKRAPAGRAWWWR